MATSIKKNIVCGDAYANCADFDVTGVMVFSVKELEGDGKYSISFLEKDSNGDFTVPITTKFLGNAVETLETDEDTGFTGNDSELNFETASVSGEDKGEYDTYPAEKTLAALANIPIIPGTLVLSIDSVESFSDDGDGTLTGNEGGSGTINYETGVAAITGGADPGATHVLAAYQKDGLIGGTDVDKPIIPGTVEIEATASSPALKDKDGDGILYSVDVDAEDSGFVKYTTGALKLSYGTGKPPEAGAILANFATSQYFSSAYNVRLFVLDRQPKSSPIRVVGVSKNTNRKYVKLQIEAIAVS